MIIMVNIALMCLLKIYTPSCRSSKFSSILVCWTLLVNTWLEHIRAALRIMISFTAHLRDFQPDTEKRYFSVSKEQNKLKQYSGKHFFVDLIVTKLQKYNICGICNIWQMPLGHFSMQYFFWYTLLGPKICVNKKKHPEEGGSLKFAAEGRKTLKCPTNSSMDIYPI